MRRDAGRTFELQIWVMFAAFLSVVAGSIWKPWGWLAGPVVLVAAFLGVLVLGALHAAAAARGKARLLRIVRREEAAQPWKIIRDLASDSSFTDAEKDEVRRAAADPSHPAREGLVVAMFGFVPYWEPADPRTLQLAVDCLVEKPGSDAAVGFVELIGSKGEGGQLARAVRLVLDAGTDEAKLSAARHLLSRATTTYKPGHEVCAEKVREWNAELAPWAREDWQRKALRDLSGS